MHDAFFAFGLTLRLLVVFLGFIAMWSLWVARRERKHLWTTKLLDIWNVQMLWSVASVEANLELFYRRAQPSVAILIVILALILTIKGVFNREKYTLNQP